METTIDEQKLNRLYLQDCVEGMQELPDQCIDLIIADPPTRLHNDTIITKTSKEYRNWSIEKGVWTSLPLDEYTQFTIAWMTEAIRVLKATGSMWVIGNTLNNGILNLVSQYLGLRIVNEVIWVKTNPKPDATHRKLIESHQTFLWLTKGNSYYFNYEYSRYGDFGNDKLKNPGKQMHDVWAWTTDRSREETQFGAHTNQKPIKLIERIVLMCSDREDVIMAPFLGSGTVCVAARKLGRNWLGFEIQQNYMQIAQQRLEHTDIQLVDEQPTPLQSLSKVDTSSYILR